MIRVWTRAGHMTFEDADAYSITPVPSPNPMTPTNVILEHDWREPLPGSLKIYRVSPDPDYDGHEMLAWFAPGGWFGLDFTDSEPHAKQIPEPMGFQGPKREAEHGGDEPRGSRTTSRSAPRTTSLPTPTTTPVER